MAQLQTFASGYSRGSSPTHSDPGTDGEARDLPSFPPPPPPPYKLCLRDFEKARFGFAGDENVRTCPNFPPGNDTRARRRRPAAPFPVAASPSRRPGLPPRLASAQAAPAAAEADWGTGAGSPPPPGRPGKEETAAPHARTCPRGQTPPPPLTLGGSYPLSGSRRPARRGRVCPGPGPHPPSVTTAPTCRQASGGARSAAGRRGAALRSGWRRRRRRPP